MKKKGFFRGRNKKRGFSLVEMLVALLIMALLAVMVSSSVAAATQVYRRSVFVSESETLSSTLSTAMANVFNYASDIEIKKDGRVAFTSPAFQINDAGYFLLTGGTKGYICYIPYENADASSYKLLVGRGAYTSLYITDLSVSYDQTANVFTVKYTIRSSQLGSAARQVTGTYRSLKADLTD
jgi:prepilin-type N-terminal cleavage/methylation domain-containing protein